MNNKKLTIKEKEIVEIYNLAVNQMTALSTRSLYNLDNKQMQTYAFTKAVILFLNSKNILREEIEIDEHIHPTYRKD